MPRGDRRTGGLSKIVKSIGIAFFVFAMTPMSSGLIKLIINRMGEK
jgi:hypothetical protein